jgi:hypothetical protein
MQISREFMQSKSLSHSFWLIVLMTLVIMALRLVMRVLEETGLYLQTLSESTVSNWAPWVLTLTQAFLGVETITWTIYGNAIGAFVIRTYMDMTDTPLFLYFVPFYLFLLAYYYINQEKIRSYSLKSQSVQATIPNKKLVAPNVLARGLAY